MLNLKEEQKYGQLRKLSRELHIPTPEAFLTLEVFDKDGKLIQRHKQRSHSWVRNAYNLMFCQLGGKDADTGVGEFGAGYLSFKDTGAAVKQGNYTGAITDPSSSADAVGNAYRAAVSTVDYGIIIGSGTNPESFEGYALQTPIQEGNGAGQLNHLQQEEPVASYTPSTKTFKVVHIRYMNNNSVNEVGLVDKMRYDAMFPYILMSRDKLVSTVTIPDTGQLKVTYTIQLTYPA